MREESQERSDPEKETSNEQITIEDVRNMIRKSMYRDITVLSIAVTILVPFVVVGYFHLILTLSSNMALLVTFLAITAVVTIGSRGFLIHKRRYEKSGNTFHLTGIFMGLNILFILYLPYSLRISFPKENPNPSTLLIAFFIPAFLCIINALAIIGLMIHSKSTSSYKAPYSFTSFLPHHLELGVKDTDWFLDGYSERPVSYQFDAGDRKVFESFIRLLMRNLLFLDHFMEDHSIIRVHFFPTALFQRARIFYTTSESYFTINMESGQSTVHLSKKDYQFLKAPISYHLLCENIMKRIRTSYQYYSKGDEEEALNVFRQAWRKLDDDINEGVVEGSNVQGSIEGDVQGSMKEKMQDIPG